MDTDGDSTFSGGSSSTNSSPNDEQHSLELLLPAQFGPDPSSIPKPKSIESTPTTIGTPNVKQPPNESIGLSEISKPINITLHHPIEKTTPTTKESIFHTNDGTIKIKVTVHP